METLTIEEIFNDLQESKTNKLRTEFTITNTLSGNSVKLKHRSQVRVSKDTGYDVFSSDAKAKKNERNSRSGRLVKYLITYV